MDSADAQALASACLPRPEDLWGDRWRVEPSDDEHHGATAAVVPERCLPPSFPSDALVADADVAFDRIDRPGAVYGVAAVFDSRAAATTAWASLAQESFAHCFASELAEDVTGDRSTTVELLGPAAGPADFTVVRAGHRSVIHHARFARVERAGLLPLALELGVVTEGPVVVVLWAAEPTTDLTASGFAAAVEHTTHRVRDALAPWR